MHMSSAYADTILVNVGATKPVRDSLDTRVINEYYTETGGPKPDMHWSDYPTGWPTFSTPAPPTDSDNDGMTDTWEVATFGSIASTASGDVDGDGYTNLEEY